MIFYYLFMFSSNLQFLRHTAAFLILQSIHFVAIKKIDFFQSFTWVSPLKVRHVSFNNAMCCNEKPRVLSRRAWRTLKLPISSVNILQTVREKDLELLVLCIYYVLIVSKAIKFVQCLTSFLATNVHVL